MTVIYSCVGEHSECRDLAARLPERLAQWACQLFAAEICFGIDPYLLAAIIDRESNGGESKYLDQKGPRGRGDCLHGHGLGQIDDRSHAPFIEATFDDGEFLWADPTFNILYAARLLRKNLNVSLGEITVAIAAYNCGMKRAKRAVEGLTRPLDEKTAVALLDAKTTGKNYVSWVLARRTAFLQDTAPA